MSEEKTVYNGGNYMTVLPEVPVYDASEQDVLLDVFAAMLRSATKDGGAKRAAGTKPPWWCDDSHLPAVFSHLSKWYHGETTDSDSGASPWVHLAWRALALGYQETVGKVDPALSTDWRYIFGTPDGPA